MLRKIMAYAAVGAAVTTLLSFLVLVIYVAPIVLLGFVLSIGATLVLVAALTGLAWGLKELGLL